MDYYDRGIDYKETREAVVEFNKELGWFQAPENLGFVVIGLLYGEGDFKKSVIYAVNCGDDTDCTGATVGATLGIIGGMEAIPSDWAEYIGDRIMSISINGSYNFRLPKTCEALTDRVAALVPDVMKANGVAFEFGDEDCLPEEELAECNKLTADMFLDRSPFSFDITEYHAFDVRVELDKTPRVKTGESRRVTLTFTCNPTLMVSKKLLIKLILPETWTVGEYERAILLEYPQYIHGIYGVTKTSFEITAGEKLDAVNRCYVEVTSPTLPYTAMIPITFIA
jgi:hypothetical protein